MQMPLWKRVVIGGLCAAALLTSAPNAFYSRVEKHNDAVMKIARDGVETPELASDKALWPNWLPSKIVNLGLDLRGGAHLLAEVHTADVYKARMNGLW
ncbi:MAG: protein translocase subunit SecD, partial [Rhodobacteraceae bacterium]|nr:protein translocase subunit SecD [Paracoccaceae bacterium]